MFINQDEAYTFHMELKNLIGPNAYILSRVSRMNTPRKNHCVTSKSAAIQITLATVIRSYTYRKYLQV